MSLVHNDLDIAHRAFLAYCRLCEPERTASGVEMLESRVTNAHRVDVSEQGCEHNLVGYVSLPEVCQQLDWLMSLERQSIGERRLTGREEFGSANHRR
jgi:hypothetical protein